MKPIVRLILAALLLSASLATTASGEMTIFLEDGSIRTVDVNRDEILSISFGKKVGPTDTITWNFETGDLRGWEATGDAFIAQPTYGDNPTARNREPSKHQGDYWIGGFENRPSPADPAGETQGDGPKGTLTSDVFTIRKPTITFLIGGGCGGEQRVELLVQGRVVMQASGECDETMKRASWNVSAFIGESAQIRLVDDSSGHWGHINFDDVRFE